MMKLKIKNKMTPLYFDKEKGERKVHQIPPIASLCTNRKIMTKPFKHCS